MYILYTVSVTTKATYTLTDRDADRFHRKYQPDHTGCWLWTGSTFTGTGYGIFNVKMADGVWRPTVAHRVSYRLAKGEIPDGYQIDHLCRVRHCVNPDHLEAVTPWANVMRSAAPIFAQTGRCYCPKGHPYDAANTRVRRGKRECIACIREYDRRRGQQRPTDDEIRQYFSVDRYCPQGHLIDPDARWYRNKPACRACGRERMRSRRSQQP